MYEAAMKTYFLLLLSINCHLLPAQGKFTKEGDVTLAGIFPIHEFACDTQHFSCKYVAVSQAMVYAIEQINNDSSILPMVKLGFEIYDSCLINRYAMEIALEILNRKKLSMMYGNEEACLAHTHGLGQVPVVIGTGSSRGSVLVSNLLKVENIPLVSYAATSDELSQKEKYPTFLRTVPPDRYQSQAMADLVRHFNWTYIAAIAVDNAYGRYVLLSFFNTYT